MQTIDLTPKVPALLPAKRRRGRRKQLAQEGREHWMDDPRIMARVLHVSEMYARRLPISQICKQAGISAPQVYTDLERGLKYRRLIFDSEQKSLIISQLEARYAIGAQLEEALQRLHESVASIDDVEPPRRWTPAHAKEEREILDKKMENERAIEELVGLRTRLKIDLPSAFTPPDEGSSASSLGEVAPSFVIDARTQIYNEAPNGDIAGPRPTLI